MVAGTTDRSGKGPRPAAAVRSAMRWLAGVRTGGVPRPTGRVPDELRTALMRRGALTPQCLPSALLRTDANRTPALLNCLATSSVAVVMYSSVRR